MRFSILTEKIYFNKFEDYYKKLEGKNNIIVDGNTHEKKISLLGTNNNFSIAVDKPNSNSGKTVLDSYYDEDLFYNETLEKCGHKLEFEVKSVEEVKIAYILASYFSKKGEVALYDWSNDKVYTTEYLKLIDKDKLKVLKKEYDIHFKYNELVNDEVKKKPVDKMRKKVSISLFLSTIILIFIFFLMLFVFSVSNEFLLSLPLVLLLIPTVSMIAVYQSNEEVEERIAYLNYEHNVEICKFNKMNAPKKPSLIDEGYVKFRKEIELLGLTIIPSIAIGTVLIINDLYSIGSIVILIPWMLLIINKTIYGNRNEKNVKKKITKLLDDYFENKTEKLNGIKIQLVDLGRYKWRIELCEYINFDINDFNKKNGKNEVEVINDLYCTFKYCDGWEIVENNLIFNFVYEYLMNKNIKNIVKKVNIITIGFKDDSEYIIVSKDDYK